MQTQTNTQTHWLPLTYYFRLLGIVLQSGQNGEAFVAMTSAAKMNIIGSSGSILSAAEDIR